MNLSVEEALEFEKEALEFISHVAWMLTFLSLSSFVLVCFITPSMFNRIKPSIIRASRLFWGFSKLIKSILLINKTITLFVAPLIYGTSIWIQSSSYIWGLFYFNQLGTMLVSLWILFIFSLVKHLSCNACMTSRVIVGSWYFIFDVLLFDYF